MQTLRGGVVGLGAVGGKAGSRINARMVGPDPLVGDLHAYQHVDALAWIPRTLVAGVCDMNVDALREFDDRWGQRLPDARTFTDHRTMLKEASLDILCVATPDDRHTEIVVHAAESGVRGILCEKPLATTLADADRMIAACQANGASLLVNHSRRWYPEFYEARRIIRSGEIGKLKRIVATWSGDMAAVFRNGAHVFDGINFFAESQPDWLMAELDDEFLGYGVRYRGAGGKDPEKDPGFSGYIHYQNGVRAFVNMSKGTLENIEHDLLCEGGRIRVGSSCTELWLKQNTDDLVLKPFPLLKMRTTRGNTAGAIEELCDLIDVGGEPSCGGPEGRAVVEMMYAVLMSADQGSRRISFPVDAV